MPTTFSSLPPELIACILDAIDARHDYLALALTCKTCAAHIVPEHLALRELVLLDTHTETWDMLDRRPELAPAVRSLTLVDSAVGMLANMNVEQFMFNQRAVKRVIKCVARLRRLTSLCLTNRTSGPFVIRENVLERLLDRVGALECLSLNVVSLSPNTKFYGMRNLRVLELGLPRLSVQHWPDLCNMLLQSPRLEVLELPTFWYFHLPESELQSLQPLPPLPLLVRFACAFYVGIPDLNLRLLEFLNLSPTIVELCCKGWPRRTISSRRTIWPRSTLRVPELPNLRRIYDEESAEFACAFLRGKPPRSVVLEVLECMVLKNNSSKRALANYAALDSTHLRVLHVCRISKMFPTADSVIRMLERFAQMFPAVEELHFPICGIFRGPRKTLWNRKRWSYEQEYPKLVAVAALFPRLRWVGYVDVDVCLGSKEMLIPIRWPPMQAFPTDIRLKILELVACTMGRIWEQYPRLECVNGWMIDSDGAENGERVVHLYLTRPREAWRKLSTKYVLTRDGLEEKCCRERGFVSRPLLSESNCVSTAIINREDYQKG